jgi:serine/threonine protein kinase
MQFYIITEYSKSGNLRQYLLKNPNLSWKDRLFIIWDISLDLERIHKAGFIHCDIHSENILHMESVSHFIGNKKIVAYISDFGLSMAACCSYNTGEIYGAMPYIAPEVLNGKDSMESDIYSIGIIMWELASGKTPFAQISHDVCFALSVYDGLCPEPTPNAPPFYLQLMQKCWHKDPSKRPKAKEIRKVEEYCFRPDREKM